MSEGWQGRESASAKASAGIGASGAEICFFLRKLICLFGAILRASPKWWHGKYARHYGICGNTCPSNMRG